MMYLMKRVLQPLLNIALDGLSLAMAILPLEQYIAVAMHCAIDLSSKFEF